MKNHGPEATTFRVPDATPGCLRRYIAVQVDAFTGQMPNGRCIHITSILLLAALAAGSMIARTCPRAPAALNDRLGDRVVLVGQPILTDHIPAENIPAKDHPTEDACCSHECGGPSAERESRTEHDQPNDRHEHGRAPDSCCAAGCACCAVFPHLPVAPPVCGVGYDPTPLASHDVGLPPTAPTFPPDRPPC